VGSCNMGQSSPERGMQSWYGLQPLSRSSNWMDMERGLELDGTKERISLLKWAKMSKFWFDGNLKIE